MDEIQYKLQSEDPVLISHAISKLVMRLKKEYGQQKDIAKTAEYKLLLKECESKDSKLAVSSFHALVSLVEIGILPIKFVITNIVSHLPSVKNHSALVGAVGKLLMLEMQFCITTDKSVCPYSLESLQHPFVTILTHEASCWRSVLDQIKYTVNVQDPLSASCIIQYFRPVILYIMCNPLDSLDSCKKEMWRLLITSECTIKLQLDILVWLRANDAVCCSDTNRRVLEMAEVALTRMDIELCSSLVPLIASLAIRLIEYGDDPTYNFNLISTMMQWCDVVTGNITLSLMTEIMAMCPYAYLSSVLKICTFITDVFECRSTFLHALLGSLLKWIAYPSVLSGRSADMAKALAKKLSSRSAKTNDKIHKDNHNLATLCHTDAKVQFYYEINRCTEAWSQEGLSTWLGNMRAAPNDIKYNCRFILSGLVLERGDVETVTAAVDVLTEIARNVTSFASHVLCLVFYKLTKTRDITLTKHLILVLPQLLVSKENAPIIIHILDTLYNSGIPLKLLSIVLYSKAVESDPRCYRYVLTALARAIKSENSWLCRSVCAKVIRDICTSRPEHGEELVPMISQILNTSTGVNGSTASTFALESIAALCRAAVIGICSTWRVLAPKVNTETRLPVLRGLCKLFGEVPYFPVQTPEDYEGLILEIVTRLWTYAFTTNDAEVARSALKALACYRLESIPLGSLPPELKRNLASRASHGNAVHAAVAETSSDGPDVSLPYVPGRCWIEMLGTISAPVLPAAGDLLVSFIEEELKGFHSGIYNWPQGEPQNFLYLPERSVIRAVGERLRRHDKYGSEGVAIALECLRVFAHEYSKPLPNVRWSFLQDLAALSSVSRRYCLLIACRHAVISASAKIFVENHLSMYNDDALRDTLLEAEGFLTLYSRLEYLCAALQPNDLKAFLETTLERSARSLPVNDRTQPSVFDVIMQSYARALKSSAVYEENRHLLSSNLEQLLDKIDLQCSDALNWSCVAAVLETSAEDIERTTSPSTWREISEMRVRNAIVIRTEWALRRGIDAPLSSLAELIDVAATSSLRTRDCLFDCVSRIQRKLHSNKAIASWTLDFIAHMENSMKAVPAEKAEQFEFYCRVLLTSVNCLSGVDRLTTDRSTLFRSPDSQCRLLPQSVRILTDRQLWRNKVPQIMEWLNNMRTSDLPRMYKLAFYNALISLKHEPHYRKAWMKYMPVEST